MDKVEKVRSSIDSHLVLVLLDKSFNHWKSFQTVTSEEIESIVTKVSNSTSPNDFAPAVFFKYFATKYSSLCSDMVNCILQSGGFPNELKRGIIVPLYKTGDQNSLSNYRPVTNLRIFSKVVEKVVLYQLKSYLSSFSLWPVYQSAYREHHSTETSLIYIVGELNKVLNEKKLALLVSLDLTSAFDTVDIDTLLDILMKEYGFEETVLKFFRSYLHGRKLQVKVKNSISGELIAQSGVPQGSILGPVLFLLYLKPVMDLLGGMKVKHHFYADDSQFIFNFTEDKEEVEGIITTVIQKFEELKLKINVTKTEMIFFKTLRDKNPYPTNFTFLSSNIEISKCVKLLGFFLDENLTLQKQVNNVCRQCYLQLKKLY